MGARVTYQLDILQFILAAGLDVLLLSHMRHVAVVVLAVLVIRRVARVEDEAVHALAVERLGEVIDVPIRRRMPFGALGRGDGARCQVCSQNGGRVEPWGHGSDQCDAGGDDDGQEARERLAWKGGGG